MVLNSEHSSESAEQLCCSLEVEPKVLLPPMNYVHQGFLWNPVNRRTWNYAPLPMIIRLRILEIIGNRGDCFSEQLYCLGIPLNYASNGQQSYSERWVEQDEINHSEELAKMGQDYSLVNITIGTSADPADYGYGRKWGEFDQQYIIQKLHWSIDDAIIAQGDYGSRVNLTPEAKLMEQLEERE